MNILPKKRWHVRTKDNIARVRRDEAEAAEQENQRVQRAKLAEQEARTAYLRTKARAEHGKEYQREEPKPQRGGNSQPASKKPEADIYTSAGNINFFKEVELGKASGGTNKEYEDEKKAEQENYEKKIGYLTYLGQNSHEAKGDRPWYEIRDCSTQAETEEVGLKSKAKLDPINDIIKYAGLKPIKKTTFVKNVKDEEIQEKIKNVEEKPCQDHYRKKLKQKRRHKKHKKEHKKKKQKKHELKNKMTVRERSKGKYMEREICSTRKRKRYNSSDSEERYGYKKQKRTHSSDSSSSASDSEDIDMSSSESNDDKRKEKQTKIEALRAERLKREAEERRRAEKLLAGQKSDGIEVPAINKAIFQQQYHSQFNPQIARQNQEPKTLEAGVKYWLQ